MSEDERQETDGATNLSDAGQRISKLNEIAELIPILLEAASGAVSLLAGNQPTQNSLEPADEATERDVDESDPQALRKRAFLAHVRTYYSTLRKLKDDLHVEVDKLSEAGLLGSEFSSAVLGPGVTNNGLGDLDIGWLNSRAKDVVSAKEKELVKELKELLDDHAQGSNEDNMEGVET